MPLSDEIPKDAFRRHAIRLNAAKQRPQPAAPPPPPPSAPERTPFSREAILQGEDRSEYETNIQAFLDRFQPGDPVEYNIVMRLADTEWRISRARGLEAATLDLQEEDTAGLIDGRFKSVDEATRLVFSMQCFEPQHLGILFANQRFESALSRQFYRDYRLLTELRNERIRGNSTTQPVDKSA